MTDPSRVAIVHERFTELGGSERVVEQLHAMWPEATIWTPILDRAALPAGLAGATIRTGWLQHLYRGGPTYAHLLPLLPACMSTLDLGPVDLVVTSHHAFANRVRCPPGATMVSYTHTPGRWLWDPAFRRHEVASRTGRLALAAFAGTQRWADRRAAQRPDLLVVNSRHVAERVRRWWGRTSTVIPPPVDVHYFTPDGGIDREDFFLYAGRLVPYKKPEVAVMAARRAGVRLVVAGGGRGASSLASIAGPGIEVRGAVDGETLRNLFRRCRALVFPGEEDFGIVPVEAQACGAPVVAWAGGGVLDSVVDGVTGSLYAHERGEDDVDALARALRAFDPSRFEPDVIRRHAERFSPETFRSRFYDAVGALSVTGSTPGGPLRRPPE